MLKAMMMTVQGLVLAVAVQDLVVRPQALRKLGGQPVQGLVRRPFLHADLHGRHLVVIVHQFPHRLDGDDDQLGVQLRIDGEEAGHGHLGAPERGGGVRQGNGAFPVRIIDLERGDEPRVDVHRPGKGTAYDGPRQVPPVQGEDAVGDMVLQGAFLLEHAVHTLDAGEALFAVESDEGLFLDDAGHVVHQFLVVQPGEHGAVRDEGLAGRRFHDQVRLGVPEAVGHELVEPVEHRKDDDERRRPDGHARHADARNDVDHVV